MQKEIQCENCIDKYDVKKCIRCGYRREKYGKKENQWN